MKVAIIGGYGFLGRRLAQRLLQRGHLIGKNGEAEDIDELILIDQIKPDKAMEGVTSLIGDISEPGFIAQVIDDEVDSIFHLAAIVSSAAEADFDLGMQINLDATRALLDHFRQLPTPPRLVFSSSIAVFGNVPAVVQDDTPALPLSSYGTQKVIGEYLANEYARKGFVDSRCIRLPTVVIRPGKPNKAASSFASSILREPLQGLSAICPVSEDLSLWIQSPRVVIENLIHAHDTSSDMWLGGPRILNLPGLTVSVREMIDALTRFGGDAALIEWKKDPDVARIVGSWPGAMNTDRANRMGFLNDKHIDEIVQAFIEDDLSS